jgi:hypothetical protein
VIAMHNRQHLSDIELAKTVLLGIGAVAAACASIWLIGFAVGLFR